MKKHLIIKICISFIFTILINANSSAQESSDIMKDELYTRYEEAYKKYISSDNYKEYQAVVKDIASKTKTTKWLDIKSTDKLDMWIDDNISNTSFTSKTQARDTFIKAFELAEYDLEAKKESNMLFNELSKKYDTKLITNTISNRIQLGTIIR